MVNNGRCEAHTKQQRKRYDESRLSAPERGYDHRWHKIRNYKLGINPLCERCKITPRVIPAALVHHKDRNPKNNRMNNLESLCVECHNAEHKGERWGR